MSLEIRAGCGLRHHTAPNSEVLRSPTAGEFRVMWYWPLPEVMWCESLSVAGNLEESQMIDLQECSFFNRSATTNACVSPGSAIINTVRGLILLFGFIRVSILPQIPGIQPLDQFEKYQRFQLL